MEPLKGTQPVQTVTLAPWDLRAVRQLRDPEPPSSGGTLRQKWKTSHPLPKKFWKTESLKYHRNATAQRHPL